MFLHYFTLTVAIVNYNHVPAQIHVSACDFQSILPSLREKEVDTSVQGERSILCKVPPTLFLVHFNYCRSKGRKSE